MRESDALILAEIQARSYERASAGIREAYPKRRAMDATRLASFLSGRRYGVLATSRRDGRPQAAPVAFTVWNGALWVASVEGARVRNLRARPYASIVIMEGEGDAHRAVIAEGTAVLHGRPEIAMPEQLREIWIAQHGAAPAWAVVLIEIRPDRLFSYDATLTGDDPPDA